MTTPKPSKHSSDPTVIEFLGAAFDDYLAARVLLLTRLPLQGAVLASTAIEKYLKAVLAFRRQKRRVHLHPDHWKELLPQPCGDEPIVAKLPSRIIDTKGPVDGVRPSSSAARRHAATREMRSTRKARRSRPRHSRETRLASISAAFSQLACLGV